MTPLAYLAIALRSPVGRVTASLPLLPRFPRLLSVALFAAFAFASIAPRTYAWEGHTWERWREVSRWSAPRLATLQAGSTNLVSPLDTATGRIASLPGWETQRREIESTIRSILGEPSGLEVPAVEVRDLGSVEMDGYVRRHLMLRSEAEDWIPAYLLVPLHTGTNRLPAMICLHQTVAQGKDEPCGIRGNPEMAFAVELVRRGYVCLAPDAIGFGQRIAAGRQPYDNSLAFYRRHPGWSFMGKMVWDVSRLIDYLETLPQVDPRRIGSIGHSHGAYGTLFAAALEPRLAAAVASCGFTTLRSDPNPERWSHLTALIPQLGHYLPEVKSIPFDWQHVLALAAPRPLQLWYTTGDTIFPRTDNLAGLLRDVQGVYALHGAASQLTWRSSAEAHVFPLVQREASYRWLDQVLENPSRKASVKTASALYPGHLVERARANAASQPWAATVRDSMVAAAQPWVALSDDALWDLMFGNTLKRAWQVWSDGHCPACLKPVPMYEWQADPLKHPWKMGCPRCGELFPKNDFARFHRSGLDERGVFDPARADRTLLFNTEHPDPADPRHRFGVDDGEGYVADGKRWRFINAYLIYGQWKKAIVDGIRALSAAYVATGEAKYAHKAGVLLDRVADLYPSFDFGREGVMYEGPPRAGYVSTWHDACVEVHDLALAYDAVFEALARDPDLVPFLRAKAATWKVPSPKNSFSDIQRNIEDRLFRDTLANRPKIESNYPMTDKTLLMIETVLDWPRNRARVLELLDAIIAKATAVDGLTGEKGITVYGAIAPRDVSELLGRFARSEPGFVREMVQRHPRLHAMYRFHLETWCLGLYYPRSGDSGSFAARDLHYAAFPFTQNAGIHPSSYAFLWNLYEATGDADFARLMVRSNGGKVAGLPYDLFAADPSAFQSRVDETLNRVGPEIRLPSVNKTEWCLAVLRSGEGEHSRAVWLDYDSGERHGHADALTLGLFSRGLDLLPDFGYPPVQYGGWASPRAVWYTLTAAHNTVAVDRRESKPGRGESTLWFSGERFQAVRAAAEKLVGTDQFERTVALVDVSPEVFYVVDLFRVTGGSEHTRIHHGHFGTLAPERLSLRDVDTAPYGEVMRRFRRDTTPPDGWSATWEVFDRLKYLPEGAAVRLRHTDFTRGAEVDVAESWVSVDRFDGTADAWIPSILTRRHADPAAAPLTSTFVSLLEPHGAERSLGNARRLALEDQDGKRCGDADVGLEITHRTGGRDVVVSRNASIVRGSKAAVLVDRENGVRTDGELALVRWDAAGQTTRAVLCRGTLLRAGALEVRSRDSAASVEIGLEPGQRPRLFGNTNAVESVMLDGKRLWPE